MINEVITLKLRREQVIDLLTACNCIISCNGYEAVKFAEIKRSLGDQLSMHDLKALVKEENNND